MKAFKVGNLGLITSLDEGFKSIHDQLGGAPAQHRLLAEEVGFTLLGKCCFDAAGPKGADGLGVGQGERPGAAGEVLLDGNDRGNPATGNILTAHQVAGALGGHHADINECRRRHKPEADVEPVGKEKGVAFLQVGLNCFQIQLFLNRVRGQDHDDISLGGSRRWVNNP